MYLPGLSSKITTPLLRMVTGIIFFSHGAARLYYESVSDFGAALDSMGFILGLLLAWIVTIGEIVFGFLLVIGHNVKYCVIFHAIVIVVGIIVIHLPQGWFVVGHGSGGVEFSLLLLAVLAYLYSSH